MNLRKKAKRKRILESIAKSRFRQKIRRKGRKYHGWFSSNSNSFDYKKATEDIISLNGIQDKLFPRNVKYLIDSENSPFRRNLLSNNSFIKERRLIVPKTFSIIDNATQSFDFLKQVIGSLVNQDCTSLVMDYENCVSCDLLTQVVLDSILLNNKTFMRKCVEAGKIGYINVNKIGAEHYNDIHIQRMINSVGSPVELINRQHKYDEIIPFRLSCFDAKNASSERCSMVNGKHATACIEYVNNCLRRFGKELTPQANKYLGYVIGETIINASEHSTLKYRYMVGYFEENKDKDNHSGVLYLVIMNYGQTIYERFKYPTAEYPANQECIKQMVDISNIFVKKNWFKQSITEETLWTLYALQESVTCIPGGNRGNGTIQFIEAFLKLKGDDCIDDASKMYIMSGRTIIEIDGRYRIGRNSLNNKIITFNESNSLYERPDPRYVRQADQYFPGTAIYMCLQINDDDIQILNK